MNTISTSSLRNMIFNNNFYWLLVVLFAFAVIKIAIATHFDLYSEEAQYWLWSKHLQLSYYSKPPLIAYLNWISTSVFGDTVFAIRINAVIIGMLFSLVSYVFAYELFKNQSTAVFAAVVTNVSPLILSNSVFFLTDAPLIFFWLCCMLFFWKAAETKKPVWWFLFGISLGLGALSKYSIFLIFFPLLLFSWKHHREIFASKYFYFSVLIGLVFFLPVILWNIRQKGVGILHLVYLSGAYSHPQTVQKVILNILEYVIGQIAILLPFYQYREIYRTLRNKTLTKEEEFLILPVIFIFFIFLIIAVIRRSGVYINWTIFAYTGVPILFAHYAAKANGFKFNRLISSIMGVCLLLFIFLTSPENKLFPLGNANPLNKAIGWSQLAKKVDSVMSSLPNEDCYVFSSDYHIASEMWFYLKGQPRTYVLNINSRMTQFDLWPGTEQFINTNKTGVFVDLMKIPKEIKDGFNSIQEEDSCKIYSQNKCIKTYYIYCLKGIKGFPKRQSSY